MNHSPSCCDSNPTTRAWLEQIRWPAGPVCPHCPAGSKVYAMESHPESAHQLRKGVYKCGACKKKFTVTVGTVFQDSHIPVHKWLMAVRLMCSRENGIHAAQLQRELGLRSYRTALYMCYRIKWALNQEPLAEALQSRAK
ncbi:MAG: transposase [Acidobacteriota bacterium]|nr:transposase [Acidobacteriota bacterium]